MSRDVFNIDSHVEYVIKAFVQRQNPFLMFQKPARIVDRDAFEDYYESMRDRYPDCPLTNRMYHRFNRRSMLTLINGSGPSRLLDNKGDWIVLDTHYVQSSDMWLLRSDKEDRMFQASYSCYLDTVIDLIPEYADCELKRVFANANMTLMTDRLCRFLDEHWHNHVILINSRPAEMRDTGDGLVPVHSDPSFRMASEHMCRLISERIPVHMIEPPRDLTSRDGNPVHYTRDMLGWIRQRVDEIVITDIT